MPTCCVYLCNNRSSSKTKKQKELEKERQITFHKFPCNPERRTVWAKAIKWHGWKPSKFNHVCSEHFTEDAFDRSSLSYVRLRETAVPTIFTVYPPHFQKVKNCIRTNIVEKKSECNSPISDSEVNMDILNDHCYMKGIDDAQEVDTSIEVKEKETNDISFIDSRTEVEDVYQPLSKKDNLRTESENLENGYHLPSKCAIVDDPVSDENKADTKCEDCNRPLMYSSAFMKHDGSIVCDKCAASLLDSDNTFNPTNATIPYTALEILICSKCKNFLSCGPVFLKQNEEAICGRCVKPNDIVIRNKYYETLAKLFKFPCRFKKFGCTETVLFSENNEDSPHEKSCFYRRETCPILTNNSECSWIGKNEDLLKHCRQQHSEQVFENPCSIMYDLEISNVFTFVLTAFNLLFLLHTKVCLETRKIYHTVQHLTKLDKEICDKFKYKLDIEKGNQILTKQGCITSRCEFNYTSKNFLITDFSVLKKTVGGCHNCIFTVTVSNISNPVKINDR